METDSGLLQELVTYRFDQPRARFLARQLAGRLKDWKSENGAAGDLIEEDLIAADLYIMAHSHRDQKRKMGGPYAMHPLEVAELAKCSIKCDSERLIDVCTGLLHDVTEMEADKAVMLLLEGKYFYLGFLDGSVSLFRKVSKKLGITGLIPNLDVLYRKFAKENQGEVENIYKAAGSILRKERMHNLHKILDEHDSGHLMGHYAKLTSDVSERLDNLTRRLFRDYFEDADQLLKTGNPKSTAYNLKVKLRDRIANESSMKSCDEHGFLGKYLTDRENLMRIHLTQPGMKGRANLYSRITLNRILHKLAKTPVYSNTDRIMAAGKTQLVVNRAREFLQSQAEWHNTLDSLYARAGYLPDNRLETIGDIDLVVLQLANDNRTSDGYGRLARYVARHNAASRATGSTPIYFMDTPGVVKKLQDTYKVLSRYGEGQGPADPIGQKVVVLYLASKLSLMARKYGYPAETPLVKLANLKLEGPFIEELTLTTDQTVKNSLRMLSECIEHSLTYHIHPKRHLKLGEELENYAAEHGMEGTTEKKGSYRSRFDGNIDLLMAPRLRDEPWHQSRTIWDLIYRRRVFGFALLMQELFHMYYTDKSYVNKGTEFYKLNPWDINAVCNRISQQA